MKRPPPRALLYHSVGQPPPDDRFGMVTPPEVLEAHLRHLLDLGYRFVTAGELSREWRDGEAPPAGVAVVTFDDGWRDGLTTATPVLQELGIRGTFYICPQGLGNTYRQLGDGLAILTEDEARALHDEGMELASHTMSHRDLPELGEAELRRQLVESREAVESLTGERCLTLAYPNGRHDARVRQAARAAGYESAFACRAGPWERFAAPRWHAPVSVEPGRVAHKLQLPRELVGPDA